MTVYFNFLGVRRKLENYHRFREESKRQGLPLLVVELAIGDRPFELEEGDADVIVRRRGSRKNLLWQKERLLNLGLEQLPEECTKVAWLDADVLFPNDGWVARCESLLDDHDVIQLYSEAVKLPRRGLRRFDPEAAPEGPADGQKCYGIVASLEQGLYDGQGSAGPGGYLAHPGFAWAARRDVLRHIGFFDRNLTGSSDSVMARIVLGFPLAPLRRRRLVDGHAAAWAWKVRRHVKSVSFLDGTLLHLWHGSYKHRQYVMRGAALMRRRSFDFSKDVRLGADGLWEWVDPDNGWVDDMRSFFRKRNEDGRWQEEVVHRHVFSEDAWWVLRERLHRVAGLVGKGLRRVNPRAYRWLKRSLSGRETVKRGRR